jgi:hypothetical protein
VTYELFKTAQQVDIWGRVIEWKFGMNITVDATDFSKVSYENLVDEIVDAKQLQLHRKSIMGF